MSDPTNGTPDTPPDKKLLHISSPDQVIKVLDTEIAHLKDVDKRPGWTPWALLGSFGGVLWLLFSQLESGTVNPENIPVLYLAFYTAFLNLLIIYGSLSPKSVKQYSSLRFSLTSSLRGHRASTLIWAGHTSLLFYVALTSTQKPGLGPLILMCVHYLLLMCISLAGFVLSFFRIPLAIRPMGVTVPIIQGLFSVATLWAAYGYFASALSSPSGVSYGDYRISLLLVVAFYLFDKIVTGVKETPLLESLVDIRRDLVFGRTDVERALRQTDIALAGLEVNDLLHEDISKMLSLFEQLDAEDKAISELASKHQSELKNLSATPLSDKQLNLVGEVLGKLGKHLQRGSTLLDEISALERKFFRRGKILVSVYPEVGPAVIGLIDKVTGAHDRMRDSSSKSKADFEDMLKARKEFIRAKQEEVDEIQKREKSIEERTSKIATTLARGEKLSPEDMSWAKTELRAVRSDLYDMADKWPTLKEGVEKTLARLPNPDTPDAAGMEGGGDHNERYPA